MKLKISTKSTYAEEGQPNPIRWMILSATPTGFVNESSWLKCKDFFNDYVYSYNTKKGFSIYGFNAGNMKIPEIGEPIYIAVKYLTPQFRHNITNVLNPWLEAQGVPELKLIECEELVIEFDPFYFANTYAVSLISLIIRLMNEEYEFKSFNEVLAYKKFADKDQQKWDKVVQKAVFFALPEKLQDYVFYAGVNYNDKKEMPEYQLASVVHNNGVLDWSRFL